MSCTMLEATLALVGTVVPHVLDQLHALGQFLAWGLTR
jgi:hypothetical protein